MKPATGAALLCAAAAVLALCVSVRANASGKPLPNFVVIVADDLGYNDLSVYGHPTIQTPSLNRMAAEGMKFTQFYSAAPICTPSRSALLTGRLPIRSGSYTNTSYPVDEAYRVFLPVSVGCLPHSETTIAEYLKAGAGYYNGVVGKWHLGSNPRDACLPLGHGFDSFLGLPYSHEEGWPGSFPEGTIFPPVPLMRDNTIIEQPVNYSTVTPRYTAEVLSLLDQFSASGAPFHLHIGFEQPHVPLFASPNWLGKSLRGLYGDAVEEMDHAIGQILDKLVATGLADNTLVVFVSDNGAWINPNSGIPGTPGQPLAGGSNAPFTDGKGSTWEGGFRSPALMWWPGHIAAGQVTTAVANMMDLVPTFLELAGVPLDPAVTLDGLSLVPLLTGANPVSPHTNTFFWREHTLYAVRQGAWKAHWVTRSGFNGDPPVTHDPPLLFNVEWDPSEKYNVSVTEPAYAAVLASITAAYTTHLHNITRGEPQYNMGNDWSLVPCCKAPFNVTEWDQFIKSERRAVGMTTKAKLFWDSAFRKAPPPGAPAGALGAVETRVPRATFAAAFAKAFAAKYPADVCARVVDQLVLGGAVAAGAAADAAVVDVAAFAEFLTLSGGHFDRCMDVLAASLLERNGHVARWFHGVMEREPAVQAIAAPNTFLVRLSSNPAAKGQYHLLYHSRAVAPAAAGPAASVAAPAAAAAGKSVYIQMPIIPKNGVYWATTAAGGAQRQFPSLMAILSEVCHGLTPVASPHFRKAFGAADEKATAADAFIPYALALASRPAASVLPASPAPAAASAPIPATAAATVTASAAAPGKYVAGFGGGGGAAVSPADIAGAMMAANTTAVAAPSHVAGPPPAAAAAKPALNRPHTPPARGAALPAAASPADLLAQAYELYHAPPHGPGAVAGVAGADGGGGKKSPSNAAPNFGAAEAVGGAGVPSGWTEFELAAYSGGVSVDRIVPITRVTLQTPFVETARYTLWKAVYGGRSVIAKLFRGHDRHRALWARELALLSRPALHDPHIAVLDAVMAQPHPALAIVLAAPSPADDLRLIEALTLPADPAALSPAARLRQVVGGGAALADHKQPPAFSAAKMKREWLLSPLNRLNAAIDLLSALAVLHTPRPAPTPVSAPAGPNALAAAVFAAGGAKVEPSAATTVAAASPAGPLTVVVHGDVTPHNCLLNTSHRLQLTGFGFARTVPAPAPPSPSAPAAGESKRRLSAQLSVAPAAAPSAAAAAAGVGAVFDSPNTTESADNERYSAPEVVRSGSFSPASDMWSFGCVLWCLWRGPSAAPEPFAGLTVEAAAEKLIAFGAAPAPASGAASVYPLEVPSDWPVPIRAALGGCWHAAPDKRVTATALLAALKDYQKAIPTVKTPYTSFNAHALQAMVFDANASASASPFVGAMGGGSNPAGEGQRY